MSYRLFVDSNTGIDVFPEYNYKEMHEKVENRQRTKTGAEYVYKFGDFKKFKFDVKFVSTSDYLLINEWWSENTLLIFKETGASQEFNIRLSSRRQPVNRFIKPHNDLYRGTIEMSTY